MSMTSGRSRGSTYGDSASEMDFNPEEDMWRPKSRLVVANPDFPTEELRLERRESVSTQNTTSTLALDYREEDIDLKTPRVADLVRTESADSSSSSMAVLPVDHHDGDDGAVAGPMAALLQSLLQKVSLMERNRPTVMAADYVALQKRVAELEAERRAQDERYDGLLHLRNGDLENLIKTRDLLAQERHELSAVRLLREDDLSNVYALRNKLANVTWALAKVQEEQEEMKVRSPISVRQSVGTGADLWQAAKTAALEQRVLELEKANKELREKNAREAPSSTDEVVERMERIFEDSLRYREKMGAKVQQLRTEKEVLQRDVASLEDRNGELEGVIERLQRRAGL